MECPICFEKYAEGNAAFGPGGDCTHTACEQCWRKTGMATRPPFRCAECRRDLTAWFVAKFDWVDAQAPERDVAEQIAEIRLLAAERDRERDREYERDAVRTAELYRQADEASRVHLERLIAEGRASTDRMIEENLRSIEENRRSIAENVARYNAAADEASARHERFLADLALRRG